MENRRGGGMTWEHFTYQKIITIWLLFIYIYFEETIIQRNMAVIYIQRYLFSLYKRTEAYILKCDILVISLFVMFSSNSEYPFIILFIFNHFQVYFAAFYWYIFQEGDIFSSTVSLIV